MLALTSACVTVPTPVEIEGLEAFAEPCPSDPPVLSQQEIDAIVAQMPTAEDRERLFWAPRALAQRACTTYERARADGLLILGAQFNQAVRDEQ